MRVRRAVTAAHVLEINFRLRLLAKRPMSALLSKRTFVYSATSVEMGSSRPLDRPQHVARMRALPQHGRPKPDIHRDQRCCGAAFLKQTSEFPKCRPQITEDRVCSSAVPLALDRALAAKPRSNQRHAPTRLMPANRKARDRRPGDRPPSANA